MKKSWFKTSDALVAATVIPILIMIIIFVQREIFPFGDKSFLRTDLYHQYEPFFSEFKYKLANGSSLTYSWNIGLGINFTALFAYYLAGPLNWILYFIPQKFTIEFVTYMTVLKVGLAGFSMTYYCVKHNKNSNILAAFFGIFYALSGYMAAYYWNVMWLDCVAIFPLVCLGVEKIINEKKCLLYVITLAFCIVSNYYISIMICIFMVIYFIMQLIMRGKTNFKDFAASVVHFGFYSLLAGAVAAILIVPEAYALSATYSAESTFPQVFSQYFSVIDMLARHMINVTTEQALDHWPNIYCGVAIYPLIALYFMNRKISLKEKIVYGFVAIFMLASFSINFLNYIWHGMHYPNSLPARQSFIYIFLVLFMGFRTLDNIDGTKDKDIAIAVVSSIAFVFLCQKTVTDDAFKYSVFFITLFGVCLYGLFIYLFKNEKTSINVLTFIVLAVISVEAAVNMTTTSITTTSRSKYIEDNNDVRSVVRAIEADDPDFFRYEKVTNKTKNDGAQMNYKSLSIFSSVAQNSISDFFREVGCEAAVNSYSITGSTPLVDALFDIRYSLNTGVSDNTYKKLKYSSGDICLYKNKYCLPLGYLISDDLAENWSLELGNPALVQNDLSSLLMTDPVLIRATGFHEGNLYSITIPEDGEYYAYSTNYNCDELQVITEGNNTKYENLKRGYFMELGSCRKNQIIDFKSSDNSVPDVEVYKFDYDALAQIVDILGSNPLNIIRHGDTSITANITADYDGIVFLSIPYEKGWSVTVDGIPKTAHKVFGSFMGIDVTAGYHDITLNYEPEGLKLGMLISAAALGVLLILIIVSIIVNKKKKTSNRDAFYENKLNESETSNNLVIEEKITENENVEEKSKEEPKEEPKEVTKEETIKDNTETDNIGKEIEYLDEDYVDEDEYEEE